MAINGWTIHLVDQQGKALCATLTEQKIDEAEQELARLFTFEADRRTKLDRRIRAHRGRLAKIAKEGRSSAADPLPRLDRLCDTCRIRVEKYPQLRNRALAERVAS